MKCPSCGAECTSKFCEYCGSEMPVQVAPVNITNNYYTTQPDASKASCPKCGCAFVKFERERNSNMVRTVGLCQGCGYTWFPNEGQKVQANGMATLEVYTECDPQSPDYECGIWVPVKGTEDKL